MRPILPLAAAVPMLLAACGDTTWTMYRSNAQDPKAREHFATFDTSEGEKANQDNCEHAATQLTMQRTSQLRYWCEKGGYKR